MRKKIIIALVPILLIGLVGCGKTLEESSDIIEKEVIIEKPKTPYYPIITTNQVYSYDKDGNIIEVSEGDKYYGQDAVYPSIEFNFTKNDDGTTVDNITNLMWQTIVIDEKMSWQEAMKYCENLKLAGYDDWRLPSVKELFSISDFNSGWPYIDLDYFDFPDGTQDFLPTMQPSSSSQGNMGGQPPQGGGPQGGGPQGGPPPEMMDEENDDTLNYFNQGEENKDESDFLVTKAQGQYWSSNFYNVGTTHGGVATAFGVNHSTGHIKGYPSNVSGTMGKYVRAVRDVDPSLKYGVNDFVDNNDGTISDLSTNLMWMKTDVDQAMDWPTALEYANNFEFAGYSDWRLPDVKELQSIVDYSGVYPAINPKYFEITKLEENENYYFWTSTSAYFSPADPIYGYAWYVAFGYAVDDENNDTHGAGAVRFSPKYENSQSVGEGGDNILNSIRLVRNIE